MSVQTRATDADELLDLAPLLAHISRLLAAEYIAHMESAAARETADPEAEAR